MNSPMRATSEFQWLEEFVDDAGARAAPGQSAGKVDVSCQLAADLIDDARDPAAQSGAIAQLEKAIGHYEKQLRDVRAAGDLSGEAAILVNLAAAHARLGRREQAIPLLEKALQLGQALQDPQLVRRATARLGELRAAAKQEVSVVHRAIVRLDLAGYSDIVNHVQQQLGVGAVHEIQRQIENFVRQALADIRCEVEGTLLAREGDGFLLAFEEAELASRFAETVHRLCAAYNRDKTLGLAQRHFHIGIFGGEIALGRQTTAGGEFKGFSIAGTAICNAVRLEGAARVGEVLIDEETWKQLKPETQTLYAGPETVAGKRDERFAAYRRTVIALPQPGPPQTGPVPAKPIQPSPTDLRRLLKTLTLDEIGELWFVVLKENVAEKLPGASLEVRVVELLSRAEKRGLTNNLLTHLHDLWPDRFPPRP